MPKASAAVIGVILSFLLPTATPASQDVESIFDGRVVHRLDLQIHTADWAKLKADFWENQYYPADLTWNGETVRNVGIRSRGHGSRSGTKPALRVDFDRYVTAQRFLGLKSLALDNLTQDPSGIHESVAMAFYARLGLPAPREAHARLFVNNQYAGLYAIVESVDKDLLARVFGSIGDHVQNDGYLYEFENLSEWRFEYLGSALALYRARFEARTHEFDPTETLYRPIETLVRLVNETPPDRFADAIRPWLDLEAFVRYVAAQNFVAEADGFLGNWGINNFYLYRLENSNAHVLIAWDADLSFERSDLPVNARHSQNRLMTKLMAVPEYNALYNTELRRAADMAAAQDWLASEIARQLQLIDAAMREDALRPYPESWFETAAAAMRAFAPARIAFVTCELERGVGACG